MGFLSSLFGFDDAKPAQSQVVQSAKIPEELKPYVTEIMKSAQTQFQDNMARGYVPYTGKTTADLTPEELQSMDRITGLTGTVDPYISEAEDIYRTGDREFTGEEAQRLMSPYQQAVTDIELRKARENFEGNIMPKFEADAISRGGGPGGLGTRAGIESAELQRGQTQLLSDIQARGSQKAYADAKTLWGDQLTRERQLAGDLGRTGAAKFQTGLAEAGALEGVGTTKRGLAQNLLDESLFKFKEEEAYPQTQLAQYSGTTYGNPLLNQPNFSRATSGTPYQPSTGQNLLGLGLTGLNIYGMGGGFGAPTPGKFSPANIFASPPRRAASGGKVGGLAGLPVVRKAAGNIGVPDYSNIHMSEFDFEDQDMAYKPNTILPQSAESLKALTSSKPGNLDLNPQNVRIIEDKKTQLTKDLYKASDKELDDMDKKYFDGRFSRLGAGSTFQRGGIIQAVIALIASSPAGALAGAMEGLPGALKELGALEASETKEIGEVEKEQYKVKRGKSIERKKDKIKFINRDADLSRLYDSLPAKLRTRLIDEYTKLKKVEIDEGKMLAALKKASAELKNKDRDYLLRLRKLEEVDLANVSISQAKIIKEFMDQYDTNRDAAIAALNKAKIDPATIREIMVGVLSKRATGSGSSLAGTGGINRPSKDEIVKDVNELLKRLPN